MCTSLICPIGIDLLKMEKECNFIYRLISHFLRQGFIELQFRSVPTAYLDVRYKGFEITHHLFICDNSQVEDLNHYTLHCKLYQELRSRFIMSL